MYLTTCARLSLNLLRTAIVLLSFVSPYGHSEPLLPTNVTVQRVVDGDTFEVRWGKKIDHLRLIGVDTPESKANKLAFRQSERNGRDVPTIIRLGKRAAQKTSELAPPGTELRLEFDADPRDRYGRLLAYAYLPNGVMLNNELVRLGFAQTMTVPPNVRYAKRFTETLREARRAQRGLWGGDVF